MEGSQIKVENVLVQSVNLQQRVAMDTVAMCPGYSLLWALSGNMLPQMLWLLARRCCHGYCGFFQVTMNTIAMDTVTVYHGYSLLWLLFVNMQ